MFLLHIHRTGMEAWNFLDKDFWSIYNPVKICFPDYLCHRLMVKWRFVWRISERRLERFKERRSQAYIRIDGRIFYGQNKWCNL